MAMNPMGGVAPSTGNVMQITATLRNMPDAQLQQYAAMHKNDPFVFPLAFQESQTRQQMRAGQAAQMAGQKPPLVVDQDLAQMTPPAPMGLPEEQGIGALNAPNLQQMADGGIAGYADGGAYGDGMPPQGMFNYAQMAPAVDLHPNSGVAPRNMAGGGITGYASGGGDGAADNPNPASGPAGQLAFNNEPVMRMADGGVARFATGGLDDYVPQIVTEARRLGIDPRVALNLFKTESFGNPNAVSNKGAAGLGQLMKPAAKEMGLSEEERFDPQKNISASLGYFKKQLNRFGDYEKAAAAYNWGPGNLKKHLEKNEGILDRLSLPKETASYLTKLMPSAEAHAETIPTKANANEWEDNTQQTAGLPFLKQGQNPGYTPSDVEAIGQRLDQAREELKNMRGHGFLQQRKDPNAAVNYQNAQDLVSNLQRTYEEGMGAVHPELTKAAMIGNPANPQGGTRVLPAPAQYSQEVAKEVARPDIAAQMVKETPNYSATTEAEDASFAPTAANKQPPALEVPPTPETDKAVTAEGTGEKKGGRDWNDTLLHLGLGLMAGQSPHALQNLGNAGLSALKHEQEMKRMTLEERKEAALESLQKQQGQYYGAQAGYLEDLRGPQAALASADKNFAEWQKNPLHLNATPEEAHAAYQTFIQDAYKNLGIIHPSRISEQAKTDFSKYYSQ